MRLLRFGSPAWRRYLAARSTPNGGRDLDRAVARIVDAVRRDGDRALIRLTERHDGVRLTAARIHVPRDEVRALARRAEPALTKALSEMARRVEAFHRRQLEDGFRLKLPGGATVEERTGPIPSVGLYVPGGAGAYPSSVLMNAIPASVARVPKVVVVTPPRALESNPAVAAALEIAGLDGDVYRIGGAQAIAALAYGTRTVPAVAKIVGPGNAWVAAAKRLVRGAVEIDREAGPSEVVVLADETASAGWVAADLLAQAEHGSGDELVALVTPSEALADRVRALVARGADQGANRAAARRALGRRGAIVLVSDLDQGVEAVNALAPEHAEVMVRGAQRLSQRIVAGAVLVGRWAPVAVGDYGIGPNHVLPTGGAARHASPLSVRDFQRRWSRVRLSRAALGRVAPGMVAVARAEGFMAHAESILVRLAG
ncbi:MAG TPA: histidinol dehydrogenase [Vicinamibacteria bacterium]